ncbi:MAG TPA: ABATE domain-containing protein [Pyrinomonadaceae bacterium]|jgi:predicted RNA-binding Zn ribbon-like protein|nr:ABATE domain-containing protein [Pyrinomonadaceae bacterium]
MSEEEEEKKAGSRFIFIGNNRCLDFINTELMKGGQLTDLFEDFADLIHWSRDAGVLSAPQAKRLVEMWGGKREGERTIGAAREFRTALKKMVERIVAGKPVTQSVVAKINDFLQHRHGYDELVRTQGGFEKRFHPDFAQPRQLLAPIAEAASDLLCYAEPSLIRKCESESCVLYFYDTTRNHARRWCSMSMCGNRMKVAAHYQRSRLAAS